MKITLKLIYKCFNGMAHDWKGNFRMETNGIEGDAHCTICGVNIHQAYKKIY